MGKEGNSIYREISDTAILIGIPYLGFSLVFDKAPYFLMNKMEMRGGWLTV